MAPLVPLAKKILPPPLYSGIANAMFLEEIANAAETVLALTVLKSPCSVMVLVTAEAFPGYCVIWMETVSKVRPIVSVNQTTCCRT